MTVLRIGWAGFTFIDRVEAHCHQCISSSPINEENFLFRGDGLDILGELENLRRLVVTLRIPAVALQSYRDRAERSGVADLEI